MPLSNLAHSLAHFLPGRGESSSSTAIGAGAAGSVIGAVLGGLTGDRTSSS